MEQDCIFCKIVEGKAPCYKIYEDDEFIAFLDIFPLMKGQTIIIPKQHKGDYIFDLNDSDYMKLMNITKKIAQAIDKSIQPTKTGMIVEGFELDHIHIKLFPLKQGFPLPHKENQFSEEEMKNIANEIKKAI
jgi:histidine triad (HIT) family protein